MKRSRRYDRLVLICWMLLASIPAAILALLVFIMFRRSFREAFALGPPLIFVGLLMFACLWIVAERRSKARWQSRDPESCTRCGYSMPDAAITTCPECGLADARHGLYRSLFERAPIHVQRAVSAGIIAALVLVSLWIVFK